MQVTETLTEGLKRHYTVVLPPDEIERRLTSKLGEIAKTVKMPGFRPGKVPYKIIKQRYAASVMGEVIETVVQDSSSRTIADRGLRPAAQPKIEITRFADGEALEFSMAVELLPEFELPDFAALTLERPVAAVDDAAVDEALERLRVQARTFEAVDPPRAAQSGDQVLIDYVGRIDGTVFDGGSGQNFPLELGSNRFIPGFEDQLIGAVAGETRVVTVTFPEHYHANHALEGKEAAFTVTISAVRGPVEATLDDAFAKPFGVEDLAALARALREQLERDYARASRLKVKRSLLDALAAATDFPVPETMVDAEFGEIWPDIEHALAHHELDADMAGKSEADLRAEYRAIAERRVRLGLLLSEAGRKHQINVSAEEIRRAALETARRYPGQERQVVEFYRDNPQAMESLRAPILEEKVVDFILEVATVTDTVSTRDALFADTDRGDEDETAAD